MPLEEKLYESHKQLNKLLNDDVVVKILCIINNKILIDNTTKSLPSINLKKAILHEEYIINYIDNMLNITINSLDFINYKLYNDYSRRYVYITLDNEDILSINNKYIWNNSDVIIDSIDKGVVEVYEV